MAFHSAAGRLLPSLPGLPVLAGRIAAVGGETADVDQITLFDAHSGAYLARVPVGRARSGFSVVGGDAHWVVFRRGSAISALNVGSHHVLLLATAATKPLDLSVSGRAVAWAENINGGGRIRLVELPS